MVIYYKNSMSVTLMSRQRGVVLIVSLVFLIALTAVAAALMQNTTTDMKMAGASQEKVIATQEAIGASDEIIYNEVNKVNEVGGVNTNGFASGVAKFPLTPTVTTSDATANVSVVNPYNLETDCPHKRKASSVELFKCNVLNVQVNKKYGRTNNSNVQVNTGVAQQLLNVGN